VGAVMAVLVVCGAAARSAAQTVGGQGYAGKTPDGQPDLQGIWQVLNSAAENLESHPAAKGSAAGLSVVEGSVIPYKPEALELREENRTGGPEADPLARCLMPGVPRITYLPYPFQIIQFPDMITITYEFLNLTRFIFMDKTPPPGADVIDFFMGYSRGHWEGNTLVVEVTNNNDQTWFDKSGNYHGAGLKVTERYTRVNADIMNYEAIIEDAEVFTRPWKISMPLYRRQEPNLRLLEYECYEFREDELSKADEANPQAR
jgi:hypothetical protein